MDIIVTIPASVDFGQYRRELTEAAKRGETAYFSVGCLPKKTKIGERCYVVHKGYVRGYMRITELRPHSFTCTTTGKEWTGKFIGRSCEFVALFGEQTKMKGFQGFRYFDPVNPYGLPHLKIQPQ